MCARRDIFFWFPCRLPSFFWLQSICKTMCGLVCDLSVCERVVKGFESVKCWTRQKAIVRRTRLVPFSLGTKHGFRVDRSCRQWSLSNWRPYILVAVEPRESWLFSCFNMANITRKRKVYLTFKNISNTGRKYLCTSKVMLYSTSSNDSLLFF